MTFKDILHFIAEIAWPSAVLIITLIFRKSILSILSSFGEISKQKERNMKFKFGGFEIESIAAKVEERLNNIANESNLEKRLQMAKEPLLADEAIKKINEVDIKTLESINKSILKNSFLINWYNPFPGMNINDYHSLYNKGLIQGSPLYDGDEIAWLTPIGIEVINKLNLAK